MNDAITDAPSHRYTARILQSYRNLGYSFYDCFTKEGIRIGIAARSFEHAKRHADRISRSGRATIVRIREVNPPPERLAEDYIRKYQKTQPKAD